MIEPTMPLDSINPFQSIDLLPPKSKPSSLILQILIRITWRTCSSLRKPHRTPDASLILVLWDTNPFIQYFKVLQCHIFCIHRKSSLSIIPSTRIPQLSRVTMACQWPKEVSLCFTKQIHKVKHISDLIPTAPSSNIPSMRERNKNLWILVILMYNIITHTHWTKIRIHKCSNWFISHICPMATSIHLIMNNPMRNTHTRFTISLCQKIKRSSITLRRLYSSHIRHGIRSYAIKIRMFQKFSGISFRRNQQNTSNRNIALASLF